MKFLTNHLFIIMSIFALNSYGQDVLIYTNSKSQHASVKDFNEKLPQLISKLENNNLSSEVIDLSKSGTKSPSSVLPSIYAQKNNKTFWYRGRYNETDRIVSFIKGAGRFEFNDNQQTFNSVFVNTEKNFDKITRLKITETQFQEGFNGSKTESIDDVLKGKIKTEFLESYSPKGQYKVYYFDIYPYRDAQGKWYLSSKIFSQHHCIDPVAVTQTPFSGTGDEAVSELVKWYNDQIKRLYQDTKTGDGLEIIAKTSTLEKAVTLKPVTGNGNNIQDFDLKVNTEISDPLRFSVAPPLDNYNGGFGQVKGNISYINNQLKGKILVDINSLDCGETSLSNSIFNQFVGSKYPIAELTFDDSVSLQNQTRATIQGQLNFINQTQTYEVRFELNQVSTDTVLVNASFEININPFTTIEKPDGVEPLNSIVYVNAQLLLTTNEMVWQTLKPFETEEEEVVSKTESKELKGDFVLQEGEIKFKTDKYNVTGTTTEFQAILNNDGSFSAKVDLNTLTFKKGNLMKKHALGDEGMQVSLFPEASIVGKLPINFESDELQEFNTKAKLLVHGIEQEVSLKVKAIKKGEQWEISTVVPVNRETFELNGKKASSIDDTVFVEVKVLMKKAY